MPYAEFSIVLFTVQVEVVSKYSPCGSWGNVFSFHFRPKCLSNTDSFLKFSPIVQASWLELQQNIYF